MKKKQYSPRGVAGMAISLFAANRGYLDNIELEKVSAFESALHNFMRSNRADLRQRINASGEYNEEIENAFKQALDEFKANHSW